MKIIKINQSTIDQCEIPDFCYCINQILAQTTGDVQLIFEKSTYDLRANYAMEHFCYLSNNDFGLKNIAFALINKRNILIDGSGSLLLGTGRILPFYLQNSSQITIKNFEIDYTRPFFSQGLVVESGDDYAVFDIDQTRYPYSVKDGVLQFEGENCQSEFVHGFLEYDPVDRRPIDNGFDTMPKSAVHAEQTANGLKVYVSWVKPPVVGNMMTIKHERRILPAIALDQCDGITLENIWIKHCGTMGVIAQYTCDININHCDVRVDTTSDRMVSANADATHFVNCTGALTIEHCTLEGQLDDAINVHGNYFKVAQIIDPKHLLIEIPHFQQVGAIGLKPQTNLAFCNKDTMMAVGTGQVQSIQTINNKFYKLALTEAFDFDPAITYCIDAIDDYPTVVFRHNTVRKNRARGLLFTASKPILVQHNLIEAEGCAIKMNGDMNNWYEATNIGTITICDNVILRKNNENWGVAIIDIDAQMDNQLQGSYFHGDIIIKNNRFVVDQTPLIYGYSFNSLTFSDNLVQDINGRTLAVDEYPIDITNYGHAIIEA